MDAALELVDDDGVHWSIRTPDASSTRIIESHIKRILLVDGPFSECQPDVTATPELRPTSHMMSDDFELLDDRSPKQFEPYQALEQTAAECAEVTIRPV